MFLAVNDRKYFGFICCIYCEGKAVKDFMALIAVSLYWGFFICNLQRQKNRSLIFWESWKMLFTLFPSQRYRVPGSEQIKGNAPLLNSLPEDILSVPSLWVFKRRFGQILRKNPSRSVKRKEITYESGRPWATNHCRLGEYEHLGKHHYTCPVLVLFPNHLHCSS